jgi:hypothetical protein
MHSIAMRLQLTVEHIAFMMFVSAVWHLDRQGNHELNVQLSGVEGTQHLILTSAEMIWLHNLTDL